MKFLPKLNRSDKSSSNSARPSVGPTFGQIRSEKMNQRLDYATAERQRLKRAEHAATEAPAQVQQALKQRGELVERRIARMQKDDRSA